MELEGPAQEACDFVEDGVVTGCHGEMMGPVPELLDAEIMLQSEDGGCDGLNQR